MQKKALILMILKKVLIESKDAPVAVEKDRTSVFYCVYADIYAAMVETIEASEVEELSARIHQLGLDVFGDDDKWKSWIKKPVLALDGKSPESMMVTKEGIQRVSNFLG